MTQRQLNATLHHARIWQHDQSLQRQQKQQAQKQAAQKQEQKQNGQQPLALQKQSAPTPQEAIPQPLIPIRPQGPRIGRQGDTHPSCETKSTLRTADKHRLACDEREFSVLLNDEPRLAPLAPILPFNPDACLTAPPETPVANSSGTPAIWQQIEPMISQRIEQQNAFPASFSLLLPQFGEVTAHINTLTDGGMNIALGFPPELFDRVRSRETDCSLALARRIGRRVCLHFKHRDALL